MPKMDYRRLLIRAKEFGMNQKQLAAAAGISEGQMCQKVLGRYPFKQSEIRRICEILNISPEEIGAYFFTPEVEKAQQSKED